jgi:hypothetical protein
MTPAVGLGTADEEAIADEEGVAVASRVRFTLRLRVGIAVDAAALERGPCWTAMDEVGVGVGVGVDEPSMSASNSFPRPPPVPPWARVVPARAVRAMVRKVSFIFVDWIELVGVDLD